MLPLLLKCYVAPWRNTHWLVCREILPKRLPVSHTVGSHYLLTAWCAILRLWMICKDWLSSDSGNGHHMITRSRGSRRIEKVMPYILWNYPVVELLGQGGLRFCPLRQILWFKITRRRGKWDELRQWTLSDGYGAHTQPFRIYPKQSPSDKKKYLSCGVSMLWRASFPKMAIDGLPYP